MTAHRSIRLTCNTPRTCFNEFLSTCRLVDQARAQAQTQGWSSSTHHLSSFSWHRHDHCPTCTTKRSKR